VPLRELQLLALLHPLLLPNRLRLQQPLAPALPEMWAAMMKRSCEYLVVRGELERIRLEVDDRRQEGWELHDKQPLPDNEPPELVVILKREGGTHL
jgi:hypothetical protein